MMETEINVLTLTSAIQWGKYWPSADEIVVSQGN
jgi:hypothetical protein